VTPRIVTENVRGIPMRVFADRPRSLTRLADLVRARPASELLVFGERRMTDHELFDDASRVAAALRERGLQPGERVAILSANNLEWATSFWGVVLAGGVVAAMNGWWKAPEIAYALGHCEPRFLIADAPRFERLASTGAPTPVDAVFLIGDERDGTEPFERLLDPSPAAEPHAGDEDEPVAIFYTSGTTGRPKGAIATHRSWIAAVQCLQHLAAQAAASSTATTEARAPEVALATMPLFHVSGCQSTLVAGVVSGTRTVMLDGRFDPERVLGLVETERVTRWSAVPTMVSRVCLHPDRERYDLTSMRAISYGGSPAPPDLPALVRQTFPNVRSVGNAYGLTESGTIIAVNSGADFERRPTSVGRPFPVIEVRIGDGGEIQLRGPMIMPGYWDDPAATAEILDEDGWLHTGDLGSVDDDGFLYVTDRSKDMIIRGGENVYPAEIEQRLGEHPDVIESAVVGIPDPDLGEAVRAIVRLAPDAHATDGDLAAFVAETLAAFKVPAHWERTSEPLPRNATGKLLKNLLRGHGEVSLEEVL
jgi:long-chain acyl-CoA synthetase